MSKTNNLFEPIKMGLGVALLAGLMGCVGYVDGGYGGTVVVPGPEVYFYGSSYDRGHDVHEYSHRGFESRAVAHPVVIVPERRSSQSRPPPPSAMHGNGGQQGRNR